MGAGVTDPLLGWGSKQYALKICGAGSYTATTLYGCTTGPNTTLAAWNNMTVFCASSSAAATFDLAYISPNYAGQTLSVNIFDPGDSSSDVYMEIIPPTGNRGESGAPGGSTQNWGCACAQAHFAAAGPPEDVGGRPSRFQSPAPCRPRLLVDPHPVKLG